MENNHSFKSKNISVTTNLTKKGQPLVEAKLIEAFQILHKAVLSRRIKQGLADMKNGKDNGAERI